MKKLLVLVLPAFLYAQDLSSLINSAQSSNYLLKASALNLEAKKKEFDSQKSSYYPTLDVGAAYVSFDKVSQFQAGNTLNIYAKVGIDLFDGFRKSALVEQKKESL